MRDMPDNIDFGDSLGATAVDATVRRAWTDLINEALPGAAHARGWSIGTPADFERILLDHVCGQPWERVIAPPSRCNADAIDLLMAIEVGGRVLDGNACIAMLNRRSHALRAGQTRTPHDCRRAETLSGDDASALIRRSVTAARRTR